MVRKRKVDRPLRDDVRLLGRLLGEVLREQEGEALYALEEQVRALAIARRRGPKEGRALAAASLGSLLAQASMAQAEPLIRAFAAYFALVNLAEQHHRMRRARAYAQATSAPPQRGSLAAILLSAKAAGVDAAKAREAIAALEVTLTLTAHPTQAARRTILEKLSRIGRHLEQRDRCEHTPAEAAQQRASIREEITALWQTDELRRERPTVGDEVKNVLWYAEEIFWSLLPELPRALAAAFEHAYGEPLGVRPMPVRLHSWVGGDMDGNPFVTPEVLADTIRAHRARGVKLLLGAVRELGGALSQSSRHVTVAEELRTSIDEDVRRMPQIAERIAARTVGEPWRRKARFMEARLGAALAEINEKRRSESLRTGLEDSSIPLPSAAPRTGIAYRRVEELIADLEVVVSSLRGAKAEHAGLRKARSLLERVRTSGFSLLELELRVQAEDARAAARWLDGAGERTDGGARLLSALRRIAEAQAEGGEHGCKTLVLSMAQSAADVLAALACARDSGLFAPEVGCVRLDVVPLLEQLDDLTRGPAILEALFADEAYRAHVLARGGQEVMVGYSDSGKEVGLLAASAALYRAQIEMPRVASAAGVPLRIFHGRGESVARGGGPAQQAILALPPGSVAGRYKATEQGEALDHKFSRPELALRSLELTLGGALLHTLGAQERPEPAEELRFIETFERLGAAGRTAYRSLVYEEPRFLAFFEAATPIDEIAKLPIGSRPSKRRAGGLEALRAIPWVFAWTQMRATLPGYYGVGSALESLAGEEELLRRMFARWPFFRSVLANVEMVLAKSDLGIAARYASLAPQAVRDAVWPRLEEEYRLTSRWVKKLTGSTRLLDQNGPLQRSIALRNPYVDPMSFFQVELLRRARAGGVGCDRPLLLTLNGIAAGLRNTG